MATQENLNSNKINFKSSVVLPNTILIISLVYFAFILEQNTSTSSFLRKFLYYCFIALDILALIFINLEYILLSRFKIILKESLLSFVKNIFGRNKEKSQEQSEDVKEFVEYYN